MDEYKYYGRNDEKILVLAAALIATLILFALTFFIGCGKDGTHAGNLATITYTTPTDTLQQTDHQYSKQFTDDTTGTTIELKWNTKCSATGCINVNATVLLVDNKDNCIVHALLPNDPVNNGTGKNSTGMTDIIITCQQPTLLHKELHIHHYHIYGDGVAEQL